jgi:cytochrome c oxidase assembly protein Cox11
MNSQKTIIALALVVAIIALGVAYAAIGNQTLVVEGTATAATSDANFDVKFINEVGSISTSGDGTIEAKLDESDPTSRTAIMNVSGLTTKGQTATAVYTIKNASQAEIEALLKAEVTQTNKDWYTVSATVAQPKIGQNGTTTLTVNVTLEKTPATADDLAAAKETIYVSIDAAPVSK